jgi:hypothetical protein
MGLLSVVSQTAVPKLVAGLLLSMYESSTALAVMVPALATLASTARSTPVSPAAMSRIANIDRITDACHR